MHPHRLRSSTIRGALALAGALVLGIAAAPAHAQELWGWGYGQFGQLVTSSNVNSAQPQTAPIDTGVSFASVACGGTFVLGLNSSGAVYAWGDNSFGQLGGSANLGTPTPNPTPAQISGLANIKAIATGGGGEHAFGLAVGSTGLIFAWGDNYAGQLGSSTNNFTDTPNPTPVQITKLTNVVAVTADKGGTHPFAAEVGTGGYVWMWGDNYYGQLGNTTNVGSAAANATPARVGGVSGVTAISAGAGFMLALTSSGAVYAWGDNTCGQLGHTVGSDGDVDESSAWPFAYYYNANPVQISGLTNITAISAGAYFGLALDSKGNVWTWGCNFFGQLGSSTDTGSVTAVPRPVQVAGLPAIAQISAGSYHALALDTSGNVWAWGWNGSGQLALDTISGEIDPYDTPEQVSGLSGCTQVAAGSIFSMALVGSKSASAGMLGPPAFRPVGAAALSWNTPAGKRGASR